METLSTGSAYLAVPPAGKGVGVILIHAWWGLNDFFKATADRLAEEGFVVLAPDLYDGKIAVTIDEAEALHAALNERGMQATQDQLDEAIAFLVQHPAVEGDQLGLVGFSMGAAWSLLMANEHPDATGAVVLFYGTYNTDFPQIKAAVQGHFAENDEFEPREEVEKQEQSLKEMNLEVTFYVYQGTGHWFFEADRSAYHAESARLAWEWTVKFLREKL